MTDFRESIGQLMVDERPIGTAWLIEASHAVTAYHCLKDVSSKNKVEVRFRTLTIKCEISRFDVALDFALLELERPTELSPLKTLARPVDPVTTIAWQGHGYPSGLDRYAMDNEGLTLSGTIKNLHGELRGGPSIQLFCEESSNIRVSGGGSVLGGVSGSPILVSLSHGDFVIGFVCEQPPEFGEAVIFGSPIDLATAYLPASVCHKSWDGFRGLPVVLKKPDGSYQSNIDSALISQVWEDGLSGFWCNVAADECDKLANAIERVLVHARCVGTRSQVNLRMRGSRGWVATCTKYLRDWVPLSDFAQVSQMRQLQFSDLGSEIVSQAGVSFASELELANHIEYLCNTWVLDKLREQLTEVFADPDSHLDFPIAIEILVEMKKLWRKWLAELRNDRCLLHNFLGLMQTGDGNFNMSESVAGAGPLTLNRCVVRPIVYVLAICTGLPTSLQLPKSIRPGNMGIEGLEGHACGIEILKGRTLHTASRIHQWRTGLVILPYLQSEWPAFEDAHQRLDVAATERSQSLTKVPPGPVVLPKDLELQEAIQVGLSELRKILQIRCQQLDNEQTHYVKRAAHDQR